MKAISLWQPWASLIGRGKTTETRSWCCRLPRNALLAIHAAKNFPREAQELCFQEPFRTALVAAGFETPGSLPRGCIVAVCAVVGCSPTVAIQTTDLDRAFGDFSPGRWGWLLGGITILPQPVPFRGAMGLFDVPDDLVKEALHGQDQHPVDRLFD